jgi:hypothetical protein
VNVALFAPGAMSKLFAYPLGDITEVHETIRDVDQFRRGV